jgi:hypothetical protein
MLLALVCRFNHRLGFHLDAGVKVVLVLPVLLCYGPWLAIFSTVVVAADAIWGDRLLSPDEKRQLADGLGGYARRFGLRRLSAAPNPSTPH